MTEPLMHVAVSSPSLSAVSVPRTVTALPSSSSLNRVNRVSNPKKNAAIDATRFDITFIRSVLHNRNPLSVSDLAVEVLGKSAADHRFTAAQAKNLRTFLKNGEFDDLLVIFDKVYLVQTSAAKQAVVLDFITSMLKKTGRSTIGEIGSSLAIEVGPLRSVLGCKMSSFLKKHGDRFTVDGDNVTLPSTHPMEVKDINGSSPPTSPLHTLMQLVSSNPGIRKDDLSKLAGQLFAPQTTQQVLGMRLAQFLATHRDVFYVKGELVHLKSTVECAVSHDRSNTKHDTARSRTKKLPSSSSSSSSSSSPSSMSAVERLKTVVSKNEGVTVDALGSLFLQSIAPLKVKDILQQPLTGFLDRHTADFVVIQKKVYTVHAIESATQRVLQSVLPSGDMLHDITRVVEHLSMVLTDANNGLSIVEVVECGPRSTQTATVPANKIKLAITVTYHSPVTSVTTTSSPPRLGSVVSTLNRPVSNSESTVSELEAIMQQDLQRVRTVAAYLFESSQSVLTYLETLQHSEYCMSQFVRHSIDSFTFTVNDTYNVEAMLTLHPPLSFDFGSFISLLYTDPIVPLRSVFLDNAANHVQFIVEQPPIVKSVLQIVRRWRESIQWGSSLKRPSAFLLALLVVEAYRIESATLISAKINSDLSSAIGVHRLSRTFLSLCSSFDSLCVIFEDRFDRSEISREVISQRPLILDPLNCNNNVARSLFDYKRLKKLAGDALASGGVLIPLSELKIDR